MVRMATLVSAGLLIVSVAAAGDLGAERPKTQTAALAAAADDKASIGALDFDAYVALMRAARSIDGNGAAGLLALAAVDAEVATDVDIDQGLEVVRTLVDEGHHGAAVDWLTRAGKQSARQELATICEILREIGEPNEARALITAALSSVEETASGEPTDASAKPAHSIDESVPMPPPMPGMEPIDELFATAEPKQNLPPPPIVHWRSLASEASPLVEVADACGAREPVQNFLRSHRDALIASLPLGARGASEIADYQADVGDTDGALETLALAKEELASSPEATDRNRIDVLKVEVKMGHLAAARATLEDIVDPQHRLEALGVIGSAFHDQGDWKGLRELMHERLALIDLIERQGDEEDHPAALQTWRHQAILHLVALDELQAAGSQFEELSSSEKLESASEICRKGHSSCASFGTRALNAVGSMSVPSWSRGELLSASRAFTSGGARQPALRAHLMALVELADNAPWRGTNPQSTTTFFANAAELGERELAFTDLAIAAYVDEAATASKRIDILIEIGDRRQVGDPSAGPRAFEAALAEARSTLDPQTRALALMKVLRAMQTARMEAVWRDAVPVSGLTLLSADERAILEEAMDSGPELWRSCMDMTGWQRGRCLRQRPTMPASELAAYEAMLKNSDEVSVDDALYLSALYRFHGRDKESDAALDLAWTLLSALERPSDRSEAIIALAAQLP